MQWLCEGVQRHGLSQQLSMFQSSYFLIYAFTKSLGPSPFKIGASRSMSVHSVARFSLSRRSSVGVKDTTEGENPISLAGSSNRSRTVSAMRITSVGGASMIIAISMSLPRKSSPRGTLPNSQAPTRTQVPAGHLKSLAAETAAYAIAVGSNMLVAMYCSFSIVALVREEQAWRSTPETSDESFNYWWSPSRRIAALRRMMLVNYGAITTASSILTQYLRQALLVSGHGAVEFHEDLRQLTAVLSILKHEARRELIECDDVEAYVYKAIYEMWGLPSQIDILNEAIEDTDRAASRISEYNIHNEDRALNLVLVFLTVATMGGIAAETVGFALHPEEFGGAGSEIELRVLIILAVWLAAFAFAVRFILGGFRTRLRLFRLPWRMRFGRGLSR